MNNIKKTKNMTKRIRQQHKNTQMKHTTTPHQFMCSHINYIPYLQYTIHHISIKPRKGPKTNSTHHTHVFMYTCFFIHFGFEFGQLITGLSFRLPHVNGMFFLYFIYLVTLHLLSDRTLRFIKQKLMKCRNSELRLNIGKHGHNMQPLN